MTLPDDIRKCTVCADRFAATATAHAPRPVPWFASAPRILIAGQAPGRQVHEKGMPFLDRSGDRLRDWMGIDKPTFYDLSKISVLPTAFCFPGYDRRGADLPPPADCWKTWHARCLEHIGEPRLRLLVGSHAIRRHTGLRAPLTDIVRDWRSHSPGTFVLPHPSWRNNAWLRGNPWFESDVLPRLQAQVTLALAD